MVAIYSTFLNRAFDQIMMDVALHADRAGITGSDGASHNGMWTCWVTCPASGWQPRDATRLREELMDVDDGLTALRFPKGDGRRYLLKSGVEV